MWYYLLTFILYAPGLRKQLKSIFMNQKYFPLLNWQPLANCTFPFHRHEHTSLPECHNNEKAYAAG
jgi:hypothetical protein